MVGGVVMPSARVSLGAWPERVARERVASLCAARLKLRESLANLAWERRWIVGAPSAVYVYRLARSLMPAPRVTPVGKLVGVAFAPPPIFVGVERAAQLMLSAEALGALDEAGSHALRRMVERLRDPRVMSVEGVVLLMRYHDALYTMAL